MPWIGELKDVKRVDYLVTSASIAGKPIPYFENLDFKIASELRKILTGNFKKQVTTADRKAQSEKRSLAGKLTTQCGTKYYLQSLTLCTRCQLKSLKN